VSYEPYNEETADPEDRLAWLMCQIIDDDAPLRWTRYRFAAGCLLSKGNPLRDIIKDQDALAKLQEQK
jgi:hypothetical protein